MLSHHDSNSQSPVWDESQISPLPPAEPNFNNQNRVTIALLTLAIAWVASTLSILLLALNNRSLALKDKVYVQMADGGTVQVQEFDHYHRQPIQIRETVTDWVRLSFEWDNRLPGTQQTDPGFSISSNKKVPSKAYAASYLLVPGFRQEFLKQLAEMLPPGVFSGSLTSHVVLEFLSEPREIGRGRYQIDLIATRTDVASGREEQTFLRKTFTLKAIEPQKLVLGEEEPLAFRKQLALLLRNGLAITDITEYQP